MWFSLSACWRLLLSITDSGSSGWESESVVMDEEAEEEEEEEEEEE
jgi:hypothetical protein